MDKVPLELLTREAPERYLSIIRTKPSWLGLTGSQRWQQLVRNLGVKKAGQDDLLLC
ncbi:MAG: hypothetical protein ACYDEJ_15800 [Desulfitobacteriaceae bacterium]